MSGIEEGAVDIVGDLEAGVIGFRGEELEHRARIGGCVEGADNRATLLFQILGIGLLDMRRIGEHDSTEITCGMCCMDRPRKAALCIATHERWQIAGMIDVCV